MKSPSVNNLLFDGGFRLTSMPSMNYHIDLFPAMQLPPRKKNTQPSDCPIDILSLSCMTRFYDRAVSETQAFSFEAGSQQAAVGMPDILLFLIAHNGADLTDRLGHDAVSLPAFLHIEKQTDFEKRISLSTGFRGQY